MRVGATCRCSSSDCHCTLCFWETAVISVDLVLKGLNSASCMVILGASCAGPGVGHNDPDASLQFSIFYDYHMRILNLLCCEVVNELYG